MAAIGPSGHYIGVRPAPPRQTRVHKEVIVSTDDCINMLRAINEKPFDRARFQQLVGRYPRLCKRPIPNIRRQSDWLDFNFLKTSVSSGTKEAIQFVVEELKLHPDTYIELESDSGRRSLHILVRRRNTEMLRFFLDKYHPDPIVKNAAGLTPYEYAFKLVETFKDEDVKLELKEIAQILEDYAGSTTSEGSSADQGEGADGAAKET